MTGQQPPEHRAPKTPQLTRQGAIRRASILDAAESVLVAMGNTEATLRAIAAEAGMRIGHLQHYFPTRADLIEAVLERAMDRSLQRLAETTGLRMTRDDPPAIDMPGGLADPTDMVAVLLAEQHDSHLVRLFVEVWALAARDSAIATVVGRFYRGYSDLVAAFIAHIRPDLPTAECRARAQTFVALIEGAALMRSAIAGVSSVETDAYLAASAVDLLGGRNATG